MNLRAVSQYNFEVLKERTRGFCAGVIKTVNDNIEQRVVMNVGSSLLPERVLVSGQISEVDRLMHMTSDELSAFFEHEQKEI